MGGSGSEAIHSVCVQPRSKRSAQQGGWCSFWIAAPLICDLSCFDMPMPWESSSCFCRQSSHGCCSRWTHTCSTSVLSTLACAVCPAAAGVRRRRSEQRELAALPGEARPRVSRRARTKVCILGHRIRDRWSRSQLVYPEAARVDRNATH